MKIRAVTDEDRPKALGLLRAAFPKGNQERLVTRLHQADKIVHEWVLIHVNRAIAYIAFTHARVDGKVVGLHLGPVAVKPEFQRQGFGAELIRFALRQPQIRELPVYVLGPPRYFRRLGFEPCRFPLCPLDKGNEHFLAMGNTINSRVTISYEKEFSR